MADPLSVIGTCIALVQLSAGGITAAFDIRHAPKQLQELRAETKSLRLLLQVRLKQAASRNDTTCQNFLALHPNDNPNSPLAKLNSILTKLQKDIQV